MLSVDLVRARRYRDELRVVPLDEQARRAALDIAHAYLELTQAHVGATREEYEEALAGVAVEARFVRLAEGLRKLIDDRIDFDAEPGVEPDILRRDVFLRAAAERRSLAAVGEFPRDRVLAEVGATHGLDAAAVETALYADLRSAHRLRSLQPTSAELLVRGYDLAQLQAVLLRAVRVSVEITDAAPAAVRALFHKLKFLRLLYEITPLVDHDEARTAKTGRRSGYRIDIDGPFSLFESVTKYGLQLALALPALMGTGRYRLEAELRWGKERQRLMLRLHGEPLPQTDVKTERLPDEVARLVEDFRALKTPWQVAPARTILHLPGVGLCVPDLRFHDAAGARTVYLEALGFWSRDAVWRRVELVERGLATPVLFAVSQHLRVSEAALGDDVPGALYVFKRVMQARAVLERVERLARRA